MKKLTLLFLSSILTFSLIACGNTSNQNSNSENATIQTEEVSSDNASSSNIAEENEDAYLEMANLMASVFDIHAGSAGCSLRAEEATNFLLAYVNAFSSDDADSKTYEALCNEWLDAIKDIEDFSDLSDINDSFEMLCDSAISTDSSLENSNAYKAVVTGISDSLSSVQ